MRDANSYYSDDIILMLFDRMGAEREPVKNDERTLHIAIYEYQQKHPKLFGEFSFSTSGTYPFSELIERVISRAKIAKEWIATDDSIRLAQGTGAYLKENVESNFSEQDLETITELAQDLKKRYNSIGEGE